MFFLKFCEIAVFRGESPATAAALFGCFPTTEGVFVEVHVDAFAAEFDAFDAEAKALFGCCLASQLDLAAGADDALPGQSLKGGFAKQMCDRAMVERITCCYGDFAVGGNLSPGNGANDAAKGVVAGLIFAKRSFENSSLEILRSNGAHGRNFIRGRWHLERVRMAFC
jgi:hypothetical protein